MSSSYIQYPSSGPTLAFADSLVNTAGVITLVGDTASPGASQYYGTNSVGSLGYYNLPAGFANQSLSNLTSPTALNQVLLGLNGTPATPAYSFTNDTGSGLYYISPEPAIAQGGYGVVMFNSGNGSSAIMSSTVNSQVFIDLNYQGLNRLALQAISDMKVLFNGSNFLDMDPGGMYLYTGGITLGQVGQGFAVSEGTGGMQGVVTLAAGTATITNANVVTNSRIFVTVQALGTVLVPQAVGVTSITNGSFTITSANATDTSVVAYEIFQVG